MVDDDPSDDRKVKDVVAAAANDELDAKTQADLARWFGLPSFQQIAEGEVKPPRAPLDPELATYREVQARALAAIDPALIEKLFARGAQAEAASVFRATETGRTYDDSISAIDQVLIARASVIHEPRFVELPPEFYEDMREATPQAVLRDLHRPETEFPLRFQVDDQLAELASQDPFGEVRAAMRTRLAPRLDSTPYQQAVREMEPMAEAKRQQWSEIRTPTRVVRE